MRLVCSILLAVLCSTSLNALTLNSRGQVAAGVGSGIVSIDGRVIAGGAGGAGWLTDDVVVYQICTAASCVIQSYNQTTNAYATIAEGGANFISANGGVWAAWRSDVGLFTSTGFLCAACGSATVAPDGAIAYKPDHNSFGPVVVRELSGATSTLFATAPRDLQLLGVGRAVAAHYDGRVEVIGLPAPVTLDPSQGIWRPRATFAAGEWWISYFHGGRGQVVLHPFSSTKGYVIHTGDHGFGHDIMGVGSTIVAAYAWNEGERPDDLRRLDIDLSSPRSELSSSLPPPPAPTPAPPAPVPAPPPAPAPPAPPREQSLPAAACAVLTAERAKLPPSLAALCHENPAACPLGAILNAAAWAARDQGLGLSRKTGGNHTDSPVGKVAADVLMLADGTYWDVFSDVDGRAEVSCGGVSGRITDPNRGFVAPIAPSGGIPTPPQPPIPAPSCAACERTVQERTAERDEAREEREKLRAEAHNLTVERDAAVREKAQLEQKLWELQSRPQPTCTASIFGIKIPCRVIQPQ